MGKMTGLEEIEKIPPKVQALYEAVLQLICEGADLAEMKVSSITDRAGIGKGTAYDYFDSKEEIIACAFTFYVTRMAEEINRAMLAKDSLEEQINYLFDELDRGSGRKYCFVKFVHAMTDNSKFSQLVRQKLQEGPAGAKFSEFFFGKIIERNVERGEVRGDIPVNYMIYALFCKILTYMMCISMEGDGFGVKTAEMRNLVVSGILQELRGSN